MSDAGFLYSTIIQTNVIAAGKRDFLRRQSDKKESSRGS